MFGSIDSSVGGRSPSATLLRALGLLFIAGCSGETIHLDAHGDAPTDGTETTATVLLADQLDACVLAVDADRLYWITADFGVAESAPPARVRGCLKRDCGATTTTYDTWQRVPDAPFLPELPFAVLAVDESALYWTKVNLDTHSENQVNWYSCPRSGCEGGPRLIASSPRVTSLAADRGELFALADNGSLLHARAESSGALDVLASGLAAASSLRLSSTHVYWVAGDAIARMRRDGSGGVGYVAEGLHQAAGLALTPNDLVFTTHYSVGAVASCPLEGCTVAPRVLASSQRYPLQIVSDGHVVYWINNEPEFSSRKGALMKVSLESDAAPTLIEAVSPNDSPTDGAIVMDDDFVYWISAGARASDNSRPRASLHRSPK